MHSASFQRGTGDRRKDRRFPMHGAIDMRATGIDFDIQATLEDISGGGCRVGSRIPLQLKHPVRISFPRPGQPELRVTGNVVRVYDATKDRVYHYGIRFRIEDDEQRTNVKKYVSLYAHRPKASGGGVDVRLPIDAYVPEVGRISLTAIALHADGMRIASDRVLRQEWTMKMDITLPAEILGKGVLLTIAGRALPGVRQQRGQYVQEVQFVDVSLRVRGELERFLLELSAAKRRR